MTITSLPQAAIATFGVGKTIQGSIDLTDGNIKKAAQNILLGLTAVNLGGRSLCSDEISHQELMKYSLYAGAGVVSYKGLSKIFEEAKKGRAVQLIKAVAQTALGFYGLSFIDSLDSDLILFIHQAATLAIASFIISKAGIHDFANGNYKNGALKTLLALLGFTCFGYYICTEIPSLKIFNSFFLDEHKLNEYELKHDEFFLKHQSEIYDICKTRKLTDDWQELGNGVSKIAFVHKDTPDIVVKIPKFACADDVRRHYMNLQTAKEIASKYTHLRVPEATLKDNSLMCPVVLEERFDLQDYSFVKNSQEKKVAEIELSIFLQKTGFYDMYVELSHNAGFLKGHKNIIGMLDFDHIKYQNIQNSSSDIYIIKKIANALIGDGARLTATTRILNKILKKEIVLKSIAIGSLFSLVHAYFNYMFNEDSCFFGFYGAIITYLFLSYIDLIKTYPKPLSTLYRHFSKK